MHIHWNARATAQPETKQHNGRPHLVVPTVALVEGVLNYPGKEIERQLVPEETLENSLRQWEGRPVTLQHPEVNGMPVNAELRDVVDAFGLGRFFNSEIRHSDGTARLVGEQWLDLRKIEAEAVNSDDGSKAAQVVKNFRSGETVDVSTGYLAQVERDPGTFNGEDYDGIQVAHVPNHLAVLPNQRGRCSLEQGCGAPRLNSVHNSEGTMVTGYSENQLSTARVPNFEGLASADDRSWPDGGPSLSDGVDGFLENADTELTESDLSRDSWANNPAEFRRWYAQLSLLGDAEAESFEDGVILPVVFPDTLELSEDGTDSARVTARQVEGIDDQAATSAVGVARNLLEEHFGHDFEEEQNVDNETFINWLKSKIFGDNDATDIDVPNSASAGGEDPMDVEVLQLFNALEECDCNELNAEQIAGLPDRAINALIEECEDVENDGGKEGNPEPQPTGNAGEDTVEVPRDEWEQVRDAALENREEERRELIGQITQHSEEWAEEDLDSFDNEQLRRLRNEVAPADYSLNGVPPVGEADITRSNRDGISNELYDYVIEEEGAE